MLSVIIPFYNSQKTLKDCLESIYKSGYKDFEVIAVDDYSTDNSGAIARRFPCRLLNADKKGEVYARNKGRESARGDILVFVDSDAVLRRDSLKRIYENFRQNNNLAAQTGILSKSHPNNNFFSQYKNLYINYIFGKMPKYVNFLYGSIFAVKKQFMQYFDINAAYAPDTELGARLHKMGHNILLDKGLEVIHLKKYTFLSFIKNDFQIPFNWAYIFMRHKGFKYLFKKKMFAHARLNQLIGVLLSPVAFIALLFSLKNPVGLGFFLLLSFLILLSNVGLLNFLRKEKGILFLLKSIPVTYLDGLTMFFGVVSGFTYYFFFSNINKRAILN